ncbi:flagellar biosynthesis anti-sigma factor FlgM [Dethiobacter alkaliphilus]|uniref:Negative regulator of flagellin synthesis n=1 Tax=Dethiobacter alkaliphilus AHT 1 TaxID=555088 RepID=C0GJK1_DETAL|nr:flagellar biosynthesis anti-sigma factor FlgM [Dethiobacter alkaliphilus]EEG76548.1 anti-sigma-28 factor, FlgM [Dethiobacter alkaliphilus AHT 1]
MKINNNHGIQVNKLYKAQADEKAKAKSPQESAKGDKLSISGEAAKVQELVKAASVPPEVRTERVEQLKEAIAKGEYTLDTKKIAAAMLDDKK